MRVDFPAPLGPIMAILFPGGKLKGNIIQSRLSLTGIGKTQVRYLYFRILICSLGEPNPGLRSAGHEPRGLHPPLQTSDGQPAGAMEKIEQTAARGITASNPANAERESTPSITPETCPVSTSGTATTSTASIPRFTSRMVREFEKPVKRTKLPLGLAASFFIHSEGFGICSALPKRENVRQPLNTIHQTGLQGSAAGDKLDAGTAAEDSHQQRKSNPKHEHKGKVNPSQAQINRPKKTAIPAVTRIATSGGAMPRT